MSHAATPRIKTMWSHVATHLSAALRLRAAPRPDLVVEDTGAVLTTSGTTEDARGPLRRRDPEAALSIWRGRVQGRWWTRCCVQARAPDATQSLTPTERAVAALAATGQSNAQIARSRRTAERTVANQMAAVLRKLGLRSRALLATPFPDES